MPQPRLLERVRNAIRVRQYSLSTEKSYLGWIHRYIIFQHKSHPAEMGKTEIENFLTYLAVKRKVSPSTQNQALQALLFLYRQVLEIELPWLDDVIRAKPKKRVPVVLSKVEVGLLLESAIRCAILSPPTCWNQARTFARFSNTLGTMISGRQ